MPLSTQKDENQLGTWDLVIKSEWLWSEGMGAAHCWLIWHYNTSILPRNPAQDYGGWR